MRRPHIGRIRAIALLTVVLSAPVPRGLADKPSASEGSSTRFAERNPRYRLQLSDEVEIGFRFTPEFNQKVTVQPDGFISLQDVGDVKVAGLTIAELRRAVAEKYNSILNEPVVSVKLLTFDKPFFVVGGEVAKPGRFDLRGNFHLSDAIAMAGGFTIGARSSEVLLFRRVSKNLVEVKKINVKMAQNGRPEEDVQLRPGDSVFVPRSKLGKVDRFMKVTRLGFYFPIF